MTNYSTLFLSDMIYFGKNLVFLRQKQGLTSDEVSKKIGFTRSQWSNYENNNSYPKFLDLIKIAKYFDISETDLIHVNLETEDYTIPNKKLEKPTESLNVYIELITLQKEKISTLRQELSDLRATVQEGASVRDLGGAAVPKSELKKAAIK